MSGRNNLTDSQALIERLRRGGPQKVKEIALVTSPGAKTTALPAVVKSLMEYNIYNVRPVILAMAGDTPVEIGQTMQAINLAESFTSDGSLAAGTYIVLLHVGEKNVFYAPV